MRVEMDKKVRPLPKRLSKAQKMVLATYPNARCGSADAAKEAFKHMWSDNPKPGDIFGNFGKNSKWAIYTEPSDVNIRMLVNVIGLHTHSEAKCWEDASKVVSYMMIAKLEK